MIDTSNYHKLKLERMKKKFNFVKDRRLTMTRTCERSFHQYPKEKRKENNYR